jgi:hypothetical protein
MLPAEAVTVLCILICVRSLQGAHTNQTQKTIPLNVICQLFSLPLSTKKVAGFDSTITGWF